MSNPLNISNSILEQKLTEKFYVDERHSVKIICKGELDDGALKVTYEYYLNRVRQSTHEHIFSKEELEKLVD